MAARAVDLAPARHPNGGRPLALEQVVRMEGSYPLTRGEAALRAVRRGQVAQAAAGAAGVSVQTLYDWRRRGADAEARRQQGKPLATHEERLAAFSYAYEVAEAEGHQLLAAAVTGVALGEVERVTETIRLDADGRVLSRDRKVEQMGPHTDTLRWLLQRRWPDDYRDPAKAVELTGKDGAPIPVELRVTSLVDQLRAWREDEDRRQGAVDANVVERPAVIVDDRHELEPGVPGVDEA